MVFSSCLPLYNVYTTPLAEACFSWMYKQPHMHCRKKYTLPKPCGELNFNFEYKKEDLFASTLFKLQSASKSFSVNDGVFHSINMWYCNQIITILTTFSQAKQKPNRCQTKFDLKCVKVLTFPF